MKKINMYYRGIWLPLLILTLGFGCKMTNGEAQDTNHRYTNGLINESSPYLLQHAHNPVNWQPWSDEALSKAKAENKLLIISIGYASCHWCHVMEHESFEDTAVARIMNEHFIPIKVDREERPDVDNVYMAACQLATQEGCGWPLNSFALPDGRPVWAGTYFPKKNWLEILEYFVKEWENDPGRMKEYAEQLTQGINELDAVPGTEGAEEFSRKFMENVGDKLLKRIDFQRGGRKGAPKFPMPSNYQFLLKYHHLTGEPKALDAVTVTLDEMAMGGIYDHLGGGFARYSVDDKWLVPHFEKMLYDNGQLVSLYSNAYQVTRDPRYKKVVEETLDYIEREMTSPEGAFYSSLDADSEGEEGKFYVWTKPEIDSILGPEKAGIFNDYYEVSKKGNWEHGKNILHRKVPAEEIANRHGISVSELEQLIDAAKEQLFVTREQRVRPGLDDKALTAWNALMLKGYVDAYRAFGADKYLQMALKNGNFIAGSMMREDGRLNRNYKDGKSVINAFLDDYALTIDAFIALYQVTFDEAWLDRAKSLAAYALAHFVDEETGFFYYTSDLDPPLITRKMDTSDNVIPGSNSMMANGLHLLGLYYYENDWIDRARNMMHRMSSAIKDSDSPDFFSNWVQLYLDLVRPPYEVAIVGPDAAGKRDELLVHYLPHAILLGGTGEGSLELLEGKLQEGETMIYVCRNKVCKLPVTQVDDALPLMK